MSKPLLSWEHRDPGAAVLVVTNLWPEPERPVYGIFVKRQLESLRAAGLRCDVLYLRGYASTLAYPIAAIRFALSSATWRGRYRLVHVHAGETALAARFHVGTPMIVSYVGDDVLGDRAGDGTLSRRSRARSWVIRQHSRLFPATITKSSAVAAALPPRVRARNAVIPNGVDRTLFRPFDRGEARRRLGWREDERVALFAATKPNSPAKRLWLAEEACRLARVRLHVAAEAEPGSMPLLMNASDCLLVTSAVEGSPNVVKEALMCNLPVVATAVGDIPERLEGVSPSAVVAPQPRAVADALAAVLADGRRSNGREVAAWLAEEEIARRILDLYATVMRRPQSRPRLFGSVAGRREP